MKTLHCAIFGHEYYITRNVTYHVKEYTCKNCQKELTTGGNGHIIELTPKFKEINDVLEFIHHRRIIRSNKKRIVRKKLSIPA